MKLTEATIRRKFMELFEAMPPERQEGALEALRLIHDHTKAKARPAPAQPLFDATKENA